MPNLTNNSRNIRLEQCLIVGLVAVEDVASWKDCIYCLEILVRVRATKLSKRLTICLDEGMLMRIYIDWFLIYCLLECDMLYMVYFQLDSIQLINFYSILSLSRRVIFQPEIRHCYLNDFLNFRLLPRLVESRDSNPNQNYLNSFPPF